MGSRSHRWQNPMDQANKRIGAKTPMPDMGSYNHPDLKTSFRAVSFNTKCR